jgi:hypothetical protein
MKRQLYFILSLIFFGLLIQFVVEYLLGLFGVSYGWIQPIIALLTGLFWVEFYRAKYQENGVWQIVSYSMKDKLSLVFHLVVCAFLIGWTYQLTMIPLYRVLVWLILLLAVGLSFYFTSTREAKPFIKKYFFDKW